SPTRRSSDLTSAPPTCCSSTPGGRPGCSRRSRRSAAASGAPTTSPTRAAGETRAFSRSSDPEGDPHAHRATLVPHRGSSRKPLRERQTRWRNPVKRLLSTLAAALLVASLFGGNAFAQDDARGEIPDRLVLGMVPSREADAIVDSLDPIAEMLSERLLIPVDTFVSTNFVGLVEAIGTGRVDIGLFGPAALVQAMDAYGAVPIVASVRQGSTTYRAQFNVRCDSGIETFEDLRGRTIAFVDPGSASGYQFPYVTLKSTYGIDPDTEMTSIFAGSHDASALAVYNGDVDVSVTFGGSPGSD